MNRVGWICLIGFIGLLAVVRILTIHSGVVALAEESSQTKSDKLLESRSGVPSAEQRVLVGGNTQFTFNLYRILMNKFEFRLSYKLSSAQPTLGMRAAFILGRANFRGMTLDPEFFLQDVHHQTLISVDENGTYAIAATAADMVGPDVPTVRLNRPFIFLIRDIETSIILFIGQVMDPSGG